MSYDDELWVKPDAIVVLDDDETYGPLQGAHVYLLDSSIDDNDYDISTFARDIRDEAGVRRLSIERLVEFYLAFQSMNIHAVNVQNELDKYKYNDDYEWSEE